MVRFITGVFMLFASPILSAQFGVGLNYQSISQSYGFADSLEAHGGKFNSQLVGGTIFYWFRLKNRRIEFLPEIGYWSSLKKADNAYETTLRKFSFSFNTDIYLFDLEGDCDCPTFSKQGGYFQKSFFIEVTPGLDIQDIFINTMEDSGINFEGSEVTYRIGLGAGFDIGISDMVTITPTVGANWSNKPDWYVLFQGCDCASGGGEWIFTAGLRVLFRPDY